MRIAFLTLGCKLNYAETSTYERGFRKYGLEVVSREEKADVYLVNTCSVTAHSDNKCRNIIRKCHRMAPEAVIVVTGCYSELRRDEIEAIEGVELVFGAREKGRVVEETMKILKGGLREAKTGGDVDASKAADNAGQPGAAMPGGNGRDRTAVTRVRGRPVSAEEYSLVSTETMPAFSSGERTRSFLKVQDGCNNFCAYCTVPYARGASRNIPVPVLVEQASEIAAQGIKEIVITGVNTGDFGRSTGETFLGLLKSLNAVEGIERYRISSIEPNLITEEIVDWLASGTKFQPHFHIPLQSGSNELLARMGRKYDTALFASRIDCIRSAFEAPGKPLVFFGIDVIAGLPGETEELFMESYNFLESRIRPAFLHIFPYSPRPGTRAAAMKNQVQDRIKTERVKRLEVLSNRLHEDFRRANAGVHERVLWESSAKNGRMSGYTGNYIRMETDYDPSRIGTIEDITI